MMKKVIDCIAH